MQSERKLFSQKNTFPQSLDITDVERVAFKKKFSSLSDDFNENTSAVFRKTVKCPPNTFPSDAKNFSRKQFKINECVLIDFSYDFY